MSNQKTTTLISKYEDICNQLVKEFAGKQDLEFDYWIADITGEVAVFIGEYFFDMSDIMHDLKTIQPKGLIMQWHDDSVEAHFKGIETTINYRSYCMGAIVDLLTDNQNNNNETNPTMA